MLQSPSAASQGPSEAALMSSWDAAGTPEEAVEGGVSVNILLNLASSVESCYAVFRFSREGLG